MTMMLECVAELCVCLYSVTCHDLCGWTTLTPLVVCWCRSTITTHTLSTSLARSVNLLLLWCRALFVELPDLAAVATRVRFRLRLELG